MKNILVVGFPRSGSTLLYNLIRVSFIESHKEVYGCWFKDLDESLRKDYNIIKVHSFNKELLSDADYVFMTVRNVKGITSSLKRMGWYKTKEKLIRDLESTYKWVEYADEIFTFKEITCDMDSILLCLKEYFSLVFDIDKVKDRVNNLIPPTGQLWYDKVTLLHPKHYE